jgi:hypothetical protein
MISLLSDLMLVLCLLVFIDLYTMLIIFDFFCLFNGGNFVFWENTSFMFFRNRVFFCFCLLVDGKTHTDRTVHTVRLAVTSYKEDLRVKFTPK